MNFKRLYEDELFGDKILKITENNTDFSEIIKDNNYYPYHYVLSYLRENLFSWYPFKEDASLLEVGSGYGQLTSLFTKKVNHVVSVEPNDLMAEIVANRSNEAIIIDSNFNNIELNEKFDYIILCDNFEYAKSFIDSETPYQDYLNYLKSFLKEDGVIIIAINNRLGLKYFAGFREEHTNQLFTGIDGYPNVDYVETFSKLQLQNIIESAGFKNYKFFYPYPDYAFPQIITTDEFVNKIPYERKIVYYGERVNFFREDKLNQLLACENLAENFSNSFLVEIRNSPNNHLTDRIQFVKLNSDRNKEFRTLTTIENKNGEILVSKLPESKESLKHINNMYNGSKESFGKIKCLQCDFDGVKLSYPFIYEKSFEDYVLDAIVNKDKKEFFKLIERYFNDLFYDSFESNKYADRKFLSVFKEKSNKTFHCHNITNLDLIFSNIFIVNNELLAIDYEWLFDFQVPLEYIFYRVIFHHRESNPVFREFITIEEIFEHFNLDTSDFKLFNKWNINFFNYVFGFHPKPYHKIISKHFVDNIDKMNEYIDLCIDSDNCDNERINLLRKDNVFNQQKLINELEEEIESKNEFIREILGSNSWKITKSLRKLTHKLK
ncbi:hypothetical protein BGI41_00385 [Methanobrevibacter sp. 87.7]|uniref:class I SAM-dependent methyltransferase n=1 Tax=Methanobrevibacter sp. 87.7 TaxID=387957 RepID=UPI000B50655D|nr:methyltransferase domain-containing protein [Methanobrevibacter sp. 87.7]OWT33807.1 hypothetical protein BGI41_00385 [Methanobrevibacter sp. 87.7]